jgi:hypothetical protein
MNIQSASASHELLLPLYRKKRRPKTLLQSAKKVCGASCFCFFYAGAFFAGSYLILLKSLTTLELGYKIQKTNAEALTQLGLSGLMFLAAAGVTMIGCIKTCTEINKEMKEH